METRHVEELVKLGHPTLAKDSRGRIVRPVLQRHLGAIDRFILHIKSVDGCWQWDMPNKSNGYGEFLVHYKRISAHRFSYEYFVGEIPDGLQIDHICRNRGCVNPNHLRVTSIAENVLSGVGITAINKRKTHCIRWHALKDGNVYLWRGKRNCRICRSDNSKTTTS